MQKRGVLNSNALLLLFHFKKLEEGDCLIHLTRKKTVKLDLFTVKYFSSIKLFTVKMFKIVKNVYFFRKWPHLLMR